MSILKLPVLYTGSKSEIILYTLFDSGADLSYINADHVNDLTMVQPLGYTMKIATASSGQFIEIKEVVRLGFYLDDILLSDEFLVAPGLSEEVIFGASTLQKWRIKLNFEEDKVEVNPRLAQMRI